jgi:hypothetical protein
VAPNFYDGQNGEQKEEHFSVFVDKDRGWGGGAKQVNHEGGHVTFEHVVSGVGQFYMLRAWVKLVPNDGVHKN